MTEWFQKYQNIACSHNFKDLEYSPFLLNERIEDSIQERLYLVYGRYFA